MSEHMLWTTAYVIYRLWPLWLFVGCTTYIQMRGKVRLKLKRQLTDHSTFTSPYNCLCYLFSAVPTTPVQKVEQFEDLKPLQANWQTIRDEALHLYDAGHIKKSENFNDLAFNTFFKRGWKRFYLKWYGDFMPSAKELCPKTVDMVQSIPSINAALFALLPGKSKLGAHRDPFAGSLRYHLGLKTPNSDQCRIYIDGQPYAWRDGEAILFDETYVHSVNNDTDDVRIILFCDVTRPLHTVVMRALNNFMIRKVVKLTETQNATGEHVGLLNHVSRYIYAMGEGYKRRQKENKGLFKLVPYAMGLCVVVAATLAFLKFRGK